VTPYPQQVIVGATLYLDAGEQFCANGVQTAATRGSQGTTFELPSSSGFMPIGNRVVFDGYGKKGQKGRNELWVSGGTRKSTHLLVDIRPGYPGSDPTAFVSHGTYVTFIADDGQGRATWRTDGTVKGTHKVNG
jgi:ELWxxDGT repeat protein